MSDKRRLRIISASTLAVLLFAFLIPGEFSGPIAAAVLLIPVALLCRFAIKKRSILSINKQQVLMLVALISVMLLTLLYMSGIKFGFAKGPYALKASFLLGQALPLAIMIVLSEYIRAVIRAQDDKVADVLSYLFCVVAEALAFGNIYQITNYYRFIDFVGITLFPAITANLLYHYLTKRYGMYPNIVYRAVLTLYAYFVPSVPLIPESLLAFFKLFVPLLVFLFIDMLYERRRKYALGKKNRFSTVLTVIMVVIMTGVVMLISNQFRFGALVVATPSMTGELNQGDTAIFEKFDGHHIEEGQVIVFDKDGTVTIHRVVDIQTVNGMTRYYTKGDANEDMDYGFIYRSDIMGLVQYKIPYVGYPTIWLRSLFKP